MEKGIVDVEKKISQTERQIKETQRGADEIHKRIEQLYNSLSKILLPAIPVKQESPTEGEILTVEMAKEINQISICLWNAIERMNDIINRIDI